MAWIDLAERSVGLILAASALAKLTRPGFFFGRLSEYDFVPTSLAKPLGACAIAAEAGTSALLLSGAADAVGFFAAAVLFALFGGVAWLELRQEEASGAVGGVDCGCLGGVLPLRLGRATMVLNLGICVVCVTCAIASGIVTGGGGTGAAMLWALAALLAVSYWITQFAFAVIGRMRAALDGQGGLA